MFESPRKRLGKLRKRGSDDSKENNRQGLDSDKFGVQRGACRCGTCKQFQRTESLLCATCSCKSNKHKRVTFPRKRTRTHQHPPTQPLSPPQINPPIAPLRPESLQSEKESTGLDTLKHMKETESQEHMEVIDRQRKKLEAERAKFLERQRLEREAESQKQEKLERERQNNAREERERINAERKRLEQEREMLERERQRLEQEDKQRQRKLEQQKQEEAMIQQKRVAWEAERERLKTETEKKRVEFEAEQKRLREEAIEKHKELEQERKRFEEEVERNKQEAQQRIRAEESKREQLAQEAKELERELERRRQEVENKFLQEERKRKQIELEAKRLQLSTAERLRQEEEKRRHLELEARRIQLEAEEKFRKEECKRRELEHEARRIQMEAEERFRQEEERRRQLELEAEQKQREWQALQMQLESDRVLKQAEERRQLQEQLDAEKKALEEKQRRKEEEEEKKHKKALEEEQRRKEIEEAEAEQQRQLQQAREEEEAKRKKQDELEKALERKTEKEVDAWRKDFCFALQNQDFNKAVSLCSNILKRLGLLENAVKKWTLPVLVQRAFAQVAWSSVLSDYTEKQSKMKAARLDCLTVNEACMEGQSASNKGISGLAMIVRGMIDTMNGHFVNAKKNLAKGKELYSKYSSQLLFWGLEYLEKEGEQALNKANKLIRSLTEAEEALKNSKPRTCLRLVSTLLSEAPFSVKAISAKAEALLMNDQVESSATLCELTKARINSNVDKRLFTNMSVTQSKCLYRQGDLARAIEVLEAVDASFLESSEKSRLLQMKRMQDLKQKGNTLFESKQFEKAVEQYTTALGIDKACKLFNSVLYSNRAAAYSALGKYQLAIRDCDIALELNPNYIKALLRRARAGAECGKEILLKKAKEDFAKVIGMEPGKKSVLSKELLEVEAKLAAIEKQRIEQQRNQQHQPQRENPSSTRPKTATTEGRKPKMAQGQEKREKKPFKSWKEKQDENWRDWFRHKKDTKVPPSEQQGGWKKARNNGGTAGGRKRGFSTSSNCGEWLDGSGKVKNYYKVLGLNVDRGSDRSAIKKAFHKLALLYHPDKNQGDAESVRKEKELKFKLISEAYSVLADEERREQYDRLFRCMAV